MIIRKAIIKDVNPIRDLLDKLGYFTKLSILEEQVKDIEDSRENKILVAEQDEEVLGFASVHFIPQLGFDGGLAIITFFSVSGIRVAKELETHITQLAYEHQCDRIQVHCAHFRKDDHKFYMGQGYRPYPDYFSKRLIYAE
jgi:hypothetical protein